MTEFVFVRASREERFGRARDQDPYLYDRLMRKTLTGSAADCWPTLFPLNKCGYPQTKVGQKTRRVHRLMFSLFYPNWPAPVVRHSCNNPACVNPAHLRGGTPKDNAMDREACGRGGDHRGTANGRAVLTDDDVRAIRASTESGPTLGARYGVSKNAIGMVRSRKSWKHVE